ncbi:unnamed protein product [Arctogadus glacialis]
MGDSFPGSVARKARGLEPGQNPEGHQSRDHKDHIFQAMENKNQQLTASLDDSHLRDPLLRSPRVTFPLLPVSVLMTQAARDSLQSRLLWAGCNCKSEASKTVGFP